MLIGVTAQSRDSEGLLRTRIWGLLEPYLRALGQAGASIVILPPQPTERLPTLLRRLGAVLLPGGVDVDPAEFGEEPLPALGEVDPVRDGLELWVARYAAEHGLPALGICRGVQVMNVALGGNLYQDLPSQGFGTLQHYQKAPPPALGHSLEQVGESPLDRVFPPRFRVNSYHHQGLKRLAPGLRAAAVAPDGLVEAVFLEGHPFYLGVQWHPELLPDHWGLFEVFLRAVEGMRGS
ncbi:MAG: gamma-glutamyl-gamma-aminobutyrate hydrolase family protein [Meiothermus sp.]|uniref:gamma-glutamyl-gamma-aminobutyrate hydrolase family protein n=1 Tax=Meiothermus sp. TaxID=1955249 RepID=UPI0025EABFCF|nr:gamma-glutamyl-gamma-aminobutyrate hydrolase family protein [Meiothermus sp.]MCS7059229.1 gamma-glutamyl-gamma-aminobutyrate hydrolase family protein [Meiothermus sp.]MCS7195336.1 gamma-glutamyl-gamma-aminobutyrate hydrolase family protein [Meiothermus sp.]MDW8091926.1 gamma-glutamyl-gamma-aminobutyrate hydrolase family protein [Meiothermus sp.]